MTPSAIGHAVRPPSAPTSRITSPLADLRRKAHSRLAERIDPARVRHKPLSLLRQEARRLVEQLIDADVPHLNREERGLLIEDVIAESIWFGTLEELFRSEDVKEILVAGPQQVVVRRPGGWAPAAVRFRDAAQLAAVLAWHTSQGEPLAPAAEATAGRDILLPNGFRLLALVPPETSGLASMLLYVRGPKEPSGVISPRSRSGVITVAPREVPPPPPVEVVAPTATVNAAPPGEPQASPDLFVRTRQRLLERIVASFASAGLRDVNVLPLADLRRVILAYVVEFCETEKLDYDDRSKERLALEILAGVKR